MATITGTAIYGRYRVGSYNYTAYWQPTITYTITETPTAWTISGTLSVLFHREARGTALSMTISPTVTLNGQSILENGNAMVGSFTATEEVWARTLTKNFSETIYKTHSSQSVIVSWAAACHTSSGSFDIPPGGSAGFKPSSINTTIPAAPSYAVTYNANSGSGQPGGQTKWYDEDLQLAANRPSKTGYTFKGWATSEANAKSGTVSYAPGDIYESNAPLSLWAVWELTYSKPSITNVSIERCDANGNDDDEGTYAKVDFNWSVFVSNLARYYGGNTYPYANNTIYEAHVTVGSITKTFTASDTQPIIVGNGGFSTDDQYDVEISITDTQAIATARTTIVTGVLAMSFFPMDFNSDASAMGILRPAPENKEGVFLGKDLFLPLDTTAQSGTDHDIYAALVALGWDSDVIV